MAIQNGLTTLALRSFTSNPSYLKIRLDGDKPGGVLWDAWCTLHPPPNLPRDLILEAPSRSSLSSFMLFLIKISLSYYLLRRHILQHNAYPRAETLTQNSTSGDGFQSCLQNYYYP